MDLDVDVAQWSACSWLGYAGLPTVLQMSVESFRSHGVDSDLMVISGGADEVPLVRQIWRIRQA